MATPSQQRSFSWLAGLVTESEPRCGDVRVVAVDGRGAAGKSTFAARLHSALAATTPSAPSAMVLHTDDFASWDTFFGWWPRFEEQILAPWARGEQSRYRRYDWQTRTFGPWEHCAPPAVLILEGVGSGRCAAAGLLSTLIWVQTDQVTRRRRAELRDGAALREFWRLWIDAEEQHFRHDPTADRADITVDGDPDNRTVLVDDPDRYFLLSG
ncbi:aminodeoxychorismate synthase [Mycobacterium sp. CBMA271]|uniref:uridine kinase family protein n=1 Tax=unclassified Mycobacteroides TaxID=2618759 RepID=UPI0012DD4010|nr:MULTISPECIES: aminodeoxychorismate synthase [unclassified Mycobacteroides]MUM19991.1 aminodeoxychorismate synthase [Mycobacteroides sp. CBMA 326]MUM20165.1 aminodeoxychorismate synthase [Mycobacteroides sp. CBMA 271]